MKKTILLIFSTLATIVLFAQSPEKFSYQAVIRDGDGFLMTEITIGMRVTILQDVTPVYVETHTTVTDQDALVYVEIGTGATVDDFAAIDWANGIYFLKIETDVFGGEDYTITSTTQILSVPYALHAKSAETISGTITETDPVYTSSPAGGISNGDVDNWNEAHTWGNHADEGYLTSFTESQILSISNDTIYLTGGSFVKLPAGFSGDYIDLANQPDFTNWDTDVTDDFNGDYNNLANQPTIPTVPTNVSEFTNDAGYLTSFTESQILSISNDTIYLTGGSFVKLPAGFSGDYNDLANQPDFTGWDNNASDDFDGDYNNLTNQPTIPTNVSDLTNDAGYLTSFAESQILSISNDTIYLTGGSFVKLPVGFSGDYNDLTNQPTIPTVPTNVSEFTNDAGYITSPDDLDSDPNNEFQVISISNDTVYLSNGGFVKLPSNVQDFSQILSNSNNGGSNQIKNIADPTDNQDAVTKAYIDGLISIIESNGINIIEAEFIADQTNIIEGETISFTDQSTNNPNSWNWDFGDGYTSTSQNPAHLFENSGTYTVQLIANNIYSADTITKVDYITVGITPPEFNEVTNPTTGEIWMDRNLGASQVATSTDDAASFGDMYQWGRSADGHQVKTSGITSTLASSDIPGHGLFIANDISNPYDWRNPQNDNLWQGVDGANNPCPSGYRLPTGAEWEAERLSWSHNDQEGAFNSPLKLPQSGFRLITGSYTGVFGQYWSSTIDGTKSQYLFFAVDNAYTGDDYRVYGYAVRCIKD